MDYIKINRLNESSCDEVVKHLERLGLKETADFVILDIPSEGLFIDLTEEAEKKVDKTKIKEIFSL
jgi:DNA anti-recombination protein RmuC